MSDTYPGSWVDKRSGDLVLDSSTKCRTTLVRPALAQPPVPQWVPVVVFFPEAPLVGQAMQLTRDALARLAYCARHNRSRSEHIPDDVTCASLHIDKPGASCATTYTLTLMKGAPSARRRWLQAHVDHCSGQTSHRSLLCGSWNTADMPACCDGCQAYAAGIVRQLRAARAEEEQQPRASPEALGRATALCDALQQTSRADECTRMLREMIEFVGRGEQFCADHAAAFSCAQPRDCLLTAVREASQPDVSPADRRALPRLVALAMRSDPTRHALIWGGVTEGLLALARCVNTADEARGCAQAIAECFWTDLIEWPAKCTGLGTAVLKLMALATHDPARAAVAYLIEQALFAFHGAVQFCASGFIDALLVMAGAVGTGDLGDDEYIQARAYTDAETQEPKYRIEPVDSNTAREATVRAMTALHKSMNAGQLATARAVLARYSADASDECTRAAIARAGGVWSGQ